MPDSVIENQQEFTDRALRLTLAGQLHCIDWTVLDDSFWWLFVKMANTHGVAPLIYWRLKQYGWPSTCPAIVQSELSRVYYTSAAHNMILYRDLKAPLELFEQAELPVIVLKGAVLARTLYPETGLRPMNDVDLLIPGERYQEAEEILKKLGYWEVSLAPDVQRSVDREISYTGGSTRRLHIELHWDLFTHDVNWALPPVAWFWERSESCALWEDSPSPSTYSPRMLTPTANLLFLTAHILLKHGVSLNRLIWSYDLYLLIQNHSGDIDWNCLCSDPRWVTLLRAGVQLCRDSFEMQLPADVEKLLANGEGDPRVEQLIEHKSSLGHLHTLRSLDVLKSMDWPSRISKLIAIFFPNRAHMLWKYKLRSPWLLPFYYPYRWFQIASDAIHNMIRVRQQP